MSLKFLKSSIFTILIMILANGSFAVTHMVSTDAEFLEATLAAVDGDVVIFQPGQYSTDGQFTVLVTLQGESGDPADVVISRPELAGSLVDVSGSAGDHVLRVEALSFSSIESSESLLDIFSVSAEIINCSFEGCGNFLGGGAIRARLGSVLVEDSIFIGNSCSINSGGAIFLEDGALNISRCAFQYNHSGGNGGAVGLESSTLAMSHCSFSENTAVMHGGGLYLSGAVGTIFESAFEDNVGFVAGGGLALEGGSSIDMAMSIVAGNGSIAGGGGVNITGASYASLSYCQIYENDDMGYQEGIVAEYSTALFHCSEMDLENWSFEGEVEFDNDGCSVATEQETLGSFKAMYR